MVGRVQLTVLMLALLSLVTPLPAFAQESDTGDVPEGARRVLLFFDAAADSSYSKQELEFLEASLLAALTFHGDVIAIVEWSQTESGLAAISESVRARDLDELSRTELAFENGCDLWLHVTVAGDVGEARYTARALDLVTRKLAVDVEVSFQVALRTRDLARRFWSDIIDRLVANLETPELGTQITFAGVPATEITGVTPETLVIDDSGSVTLTLPNPNVFTYRATRLGYDPLSGVLVVGDDEETVQLEQTASPRNQIEGGLSTFNFPGVSYGRDIIPDFVFVRARVVTYAVGFQNQDRSDGGLSFLSEPLTEISVHAAGYFIAPDRRVRGYGGFSGGIRIVHSRYLFGFEPIAPITGGVVLGVEVEPVPGIFTYLELTPTMLFTSVPRFLSGVFESTNDMPVVPTASVGYFDPFRIFVGVKYRW